MKCHSLVLSGFFAAAAVLIPGGESFLPVSLKSRHKTSSIINTNTKKISIRSTSLNSASTNNDNMVSAQEQEAKKICPLLPPPEDVTANFEAAMGWFWGPQRDFDREEGIVDSVAGYSGSTSRGSENPADQNPTYRNIQDYAESIRLIFNKDKLTYEQVLEMFFDFHTPSDPRWAGTQYRSAIFVHTNDQKQLAEQACKARGELGKLISVEEASDFYKAEEYHQKYVEKQTSNAYR